MKAGGHVEPGFKRGEDFLHPVTRKHATGVCHAHDHGFRTLRHRLGDGEIGEARISLAALKA